MKKLLPFIVIYCVVSALTFLASVVAIRGFPFFPRNVCITTKESETVQLEKGEYTVLYYIEGGQSLPVSRGDVGSIEIEAMSKGDASPIALTAANDSVAETPQGQGKRSQAVCRFYLPAKAMLQVKSRFAALGYQGLIIRTGLKKPIASVIFFEVFVVIVSMVLTWFYYHEHEFQ
jgi:hypothetical protein